MEKHSRHSRSQGSHHRHSHSTEKRPKHLAGKLLALLQAAFVCSIDRSSVEQRHGPHEIYDSADRSTHHIVWADLRTSVCQK